MAEAIINDLCRAAKRGENHAVLAAFAKLPADAISPDLVTARIVALVREAKWEDVLTATESSSAHAYLRAYALYKLDRFQDALTAIDAHTRGASDTPEEYAHLRGQSLYRLGRYEEAMSVYHTLLRELVAAGSASDEELADVRVSLCACAVAAGEGARVLAGEGAAGGDAELASLADSIARGRGAKTGASYELLYNIACALTDAGEPAKAMRALMASIVVCEEAMTADGADAEAIADDLAIVRAQAAYLLQCAHMDEAAAALYHHVLAATPTPSDVSVLPGIAANLAQIRCTGRDVVDSHKRLRAVLPSLSGSRLLRGQMFGFHYNRTVVALRMRRFDEARAALVEVQQQVASLPPVLSARLAAPEAVAILAAAVAAGPVGALGTEYRTAIEQVTTGLAGVAARAQMLLDAGRTEEAGSLVLSALPQPLQPAGAAAAAHALLTAGRADDAESAMSACVTAWEPVSGSALHACDARFLRAALRSHRGDKPGAEADYEAVLARKDISNDVRGAASAALAILLVEQYASSPAGDAAAAMRRADELVREATNLAGLGGRRPSFADVSRFTAAAMDQLEWASETVATAAVSSGVSAVPSSPRAGAAPEDSAARDAVRKAAKKRRALKQRAKRREKYVSRLAASGAFGLLGVPRPDPERWLPKRERTYGKKSRAKKIASRMNVSSGGAQGAASGAAAELLARELDAKARADAAKAREAAKPATAAAPAPAPVPPPGAGKRPAKGKRR